MMELQWNHSVILFQSGSMWNANADSLSKVFSNVSLPAPERHLVVEGSGLSAVFKKIIASKKRILFGLFYDNVARRVVCEAYKAKISAPNYVWIFVGWYTPDWYLSTSGTNCTSTQMKEALDGHFTLDFIQLRSDYSAMTLTGRTVRKVIDDYRNMFEESTDKPLNETFSLYQAYGYDAVLAIAQMLDRVAAENWPVDSLMQSSYGDLKSKLELAVNSSSFEFEGLTGRVAIATSRSIDIEIRYVRTIEPDPWPPVVFRYNAENQSISPLFQPIHWTTADGSKPLDAPQNQTEYLDQGIFIATTTIASVGIVLAVVMLVFNEYNRDKRVMKLSSPRLNTLIAIGAVAVYLGVICMGLDGTFYPISSTSLAFCYMHVILLTIGFTLTFGSMFVKTWRVNVVMKRSRMGRSNFKLTDQILFAVVGVFLLVDAFLLGLWFGLNPFDSKKERDRSDFNVQYFHERCYTEHSDRWSYIIVAYKALLLAFGVFLAWETRKVTTVSLNDSRYIAMSVYNTVLLCIVAFAFAFIPTKGWTYILVSITIIIMVTVVLCLVFVPKVYILLVEGDKAVGVGGRIIMERKTSGEHTIAKKSDIKNLHKEDKEQKLAIKKLLDEQNLSDETIAHVREQFQLDLDHRDHSNSIIVELKENGEETLPGTSAEFATT